MGGCCTGVGTREGMVSGFKAAEMDGPFKCFVYLFPGEFSQGSNFVKPLITITKEYTGKKMN